MTRRGGGRRGRPLASGSAVKSAVSRQAQTLPHPSRPGSRQDRRPLRGLTVTSLLDHAARDAAAGVPGRVGLIVILAGVDNERRALRSEQRVRLALLQRDIPVEHLDRDLATGGHVQVGHVSGVVTLGMVVSLILLVGALPAHKELPKDLLISAAFLWFTNILVFALWYWRLDAGGPHGRDSRFGHPDGAFLFPQMTMPPVAKTMAGQHGWSPNFVDYLFLAFNTSTAFSPTDVPVLERWAKVLMMLQSIISLMVVALLAAHAINIL